MQHQAVGCHASVNCECSFPRHRLPLFTEPWFTRVVYLGRWQFFPFLGCLLWLGILFFLWDFFHRHVDVWSKNKNWSKLEPAHRVISINLTEKRGCKHFNNRETDEKYVFCISFLYWAYSTYKIASKFMPHLRNLLCRLTVWYGWGRASANCVATGFSTHLGIGVYQVEAQLDYVPGSEIGVGWKIGVTCSRKRGFKMVATELGYLLTKLSFWLSLWRDISISWHGWKQRIISLVCFANNAIRPWPQVMPIFDREMPPGSTPAFVYVAILPISPFWRIRETNPRTCTRTLGGKHTRKSANFW